MAQKSYLNKILSNISIQLSTIRQFLNHYSLEAISASYQELSNERKELISPIYLPDHQYIKLWQEQCYAGKGFAVNESEIFTGRGERVRSKSEKIIADKLLMMGIPYKYECPLQLKKGGIVYPDFTLLNVKERKEIYLEHLGRGKETRSFPEHVRNKNRKKRKRKSASRLYAFSLRGNIYMTQFSRCVPFWARPVDSMAHVCYLLLSSCKRKQSEKMDIREV